MPHEPPIDVPVIFQGRLLPVVRGEIEVVHLFNGYMYTPTIRHITELDPLIRAKIYERYQLENGDMIRYLPGINTVNPNGITYELYRVTDGGDIVTVVRPTRGVGGKRLRKSGKSGKSGKGRKSRKTIQTRKH